MDRRMGALGNSELVAYHDTNEVTFAAANAPDTKAQAADYCRGFHVSAGGVLTVKFPGESTGRALSVKDGNYYPYSVSIFMSTGTTLVAGKVIALR